MRIKLVKSLCAAFVIGCVMSQGTLAGTLGGEPPDFVNMYPNDNTTFTAVIGSSTVTGTLGPTPDDNQDPFNVTIPATLVVTSITYSGPSGSHNLTGCGLTGVGNLNQSFSSDSSGCTLGWFISVDFSVSASGWTVTINTAPSGDFDGDGDLDCADRAALEAEDAAGTNNLLFDMNGDGVVNAADVDAWNDAAAAAGGGCSPGGAVCGNGIRETGEDCDGGECCASDCTFQPAGMLCGDASDTACDGPDTCDGAGVCNANFAAPGAICSDGDACTSGTGVPGLPDLCDGTGACSDTLPVDCDNGLYCDGVETCDATLGCQAGTPPTCDDGAFCNGLETCNDETDTCDAGTPPNCDDGVGCTDDSCNESTGSCDNVANDANCDNGMFCDGAETCDAVSDCQAGAPPTCDDGAFCNGIENCNEETDTCDAGTPPNCDDGVGCTDDSCNEETDSCDNVANDANCDNGLFCDGAEACDATLDCQDAVDPCDPVVEYCDEVEDFCLTASEVIDNILTDVAALEAAGSVNGGQENSLRRQLWQVQRWIDSDRPHVACNKLGAFIGHVSGLVSGGVLTEAEGAQLLASAEIVRGLLGCGHESGASKLDATFRQNGGR